MFDHSDYWSRCQALAQKLKQQSLEQPVPPAAVIPPQVQPGPSPLAPGLPAAPPASLQSVQKPVLAKSALAKSALAKPALEAKGRLPQNTHPSQRSRSRPSAQQLDGTQPSPPQPRRISKRPLSWSCCAMVRVSFPDPIPQRLVSQNPLNQELLAAPRLPPSSGVSLPSLGRF